MKRRAFLALTLTAVGLQLGPRPSKWAQAGQNGELANLPPIPSGYIMPFNAPRLPHGWLRCDGRVLRRRDYPGLAKVIGRAYGSVGVETFRIPDLRANRPPHATVHPLARPDWIIKT